VSDNINDDDVSDNINRDGSLFFLTLPTYYLCDFSKNIKTILFIKQTYSIF
jgi:hypothetical protein